MEGQSHPLYFERYLDFSILMRNINIFVEDQAQEVFLVAILQRFSFKYNVAVKPKSVSARGGIGKVIKE